MRRLWGITVLLLAAGCREAELQPAEAPEAPPEVGVLKVHLEPIAESVELPGRVVASRSADVRPQVNGVIRRRLFEEGSTVAAGQVLFEIDDAAYRSAHALAQAQLQRAEVKLASLVKTHRRNQDLLAQGMVSRQFYEDSEAALAQAGADRDAARAQAASAGVDLERTRVRAPIAGRIGRALASEGALATQGQDAPLAQIVQIDPVWVDLVQAQPSPQLKGVPVRLRLDGTAARTHTGELLFSEAWVDPATGAATLRARVPNPKGELLPGMFVRAELPQARWPQAARLPFAAVQPGNGGHATVWVLDARQTVQPREVQASALKDGDWAVHAGLHDGDMVLVDGLRRTAPGRQVRPATVATAR